MSADIANIEEGLLSLWHMENWTDDDLRKHVPAVRKTITSLRARLAEAERIRADDVATVRLLQEQLRIGNDALTKTRLRLAELLCEEDMLLALEKSNNE